MRRFTTIQSLAMLVAAAIGAGDARLVAAVGAASSCILVLLHRGAYTPVGRFGLANAITAVRLGIVVVLTTVPSVGPDAALLVLAFLVLDGLDGWVARRPPATTSHFGARFDMETDALFVFAFGLKLFQVGRLGAWIVVPGALRYVYAAAVALAPRLAEAPPSRFGRVIAGTMMVSLAASAWPLEPVHRPFAVLASSLVVLSFARSAVQSMLARPVVGGLE